MATTQVIDVPPSRLEILKVLNHIKKQRDFDGQGSETTINNLINQTLNGTYDSGLFAVWMRKVSKAKLTNKQFFVFEFNGEIYSTENVRSDEQIKDYWTEPRKMNKL